MRSIVSAPDIDTCTVYWPPCSFPDNIAFNGLKIVEWSDSGAGGTFGRLDDNGQFVAETDPTKVSHYKPPEGFTGHIGIVVEVDDIPRATDPATNQEVATYDDPPVTSDPTYFTVWEFEIDPPYIDQLPRDGATYTFTATIRPDVDHNGTSMARIIEFGLGTSSEPGYCLNATRMERQWTDTTEEDNDLKFVPNQPGLEVFAEGSNPTNYSIARTTKAKLSASVRVRCLDYGAFGSVWACAYGLGIAQWKGTLIEQGAQIPLDQRDGLDNDGDGRVDEDLMDGQDNDGDGRVDEDAAGNYIYDGWQWNNGAATDDNDPDPVNQIPPANQPRPGDGLSRYEEYRGFVIQGAHQRLNPNTKDVFIYVPNPYRGVLSLAAFQRLNLQVHQVRWEEFDAVVQQPRDNDEDGRVDEEPLDGVDNDGDGWTDEDPPEALNPDIDLCSLLINHYWKTAHAMSQRVIVLTYENIPRLGSLLVHYPVRLTVLSVFVIYEF